MKYYKDPSNNAVHAYAADGSQDSFIHSDLIPISEQQALEIANQTKEPLTSEQIKQIRQQMFEKEADPLFFKAQRGEVTMDQWLAKITEIRSRVIE